MGELKIAVFNDKIFFEADSLDDYFEMRKNMKDMPVIMQDFIDIFRKELKGLAAEVKIQDASIQMNKSNKWKTFNA